MREEVIRKYRPFPPIDLPSRKWPKETITQAPIWCSVDLRDGNQALITPMDLNKKLLLFKLLVKIGFKEIEVGFPSASKVEFSFIRTLIEENLIPDDVRVQVLVQARKHLIKRTFEALEGTEKAIVHLYNSTSTTQRNIVFKKTQEEITKIALEGVDWIKEESEKTDTKIFLEYSPESFTATELDFAAAISNAVIKRWGADANNPVIINLPSTVEMATPNIYADQIEWMSNNLLSREHVIISAHTHNDRGTSVAASELAQMAGAQRVEGTLMGNGERTGNVDIITLALNLLTQGVNPKLDLSDLNEVKEVTEKCTEITTHVRHPYIGNLVYTAFSGSHQDAIKKGMNYQKQRKDPIWEIPYLPIDPSDVGRTYEDIIRINSQSGKGGIAYILENEHGYQLPKMMYPEVGKLIQRYADATGKEINKDSIAKIFEDHYLYQKEHLKLIGYKILNEVNSDKPIRLELSFFYEGEKYVEIGEGNGPIDACKSALMKIYPHEFTIISYNEHSRGERSSAEALSYIKLETKDFSTNYGVGRDTDITVATIRAMFSALNIAYQLG